MSRSLWMFIGLVSEDRDYYLVWASDAVEAMSEGRRLSGYSDPKYEDDDFTVMAATALDILEWSPALLNRSLQTERFGAMNLDTDDTRQYLTSMVRGIQTAGGKPEENGSA